MADPKVGLVRWTKRIIVATGLCSFTFLFLYPLLWMVITSLKEPAEILISPPTIVPSEFRVQNYGDALRTVPAYQYFMNTLFLSVLNVVGTLVSCSLAAYGFACIQWKGRDALFVVTVATMMVPFPVLMIPLYSMFQSVGWIGTLKPLWVPSFFGTAYSIFLLRQFFMTIPKDLTETARMDGCSEFRIFWQIVLPLSKPALLAVALFSFLSVWNDLVGPLVYITDQQQFTLALGLQDYSNQPGGSPYNTLMAMSVLITVPVIVLYLFGQKTFLHGISITGLRH
ncbi:MAG: carbohydrate ABC transporter permease [Sumerlaeia bacterium]